MNDEVVFCQNLQKSYNGIRVLNGVNLTLKEGEMAAIVGPSGCGKSTLLHLVGLMETPDNGILKLFGRETDGLREAERTSMRRESIGFMFQFHNLLPELTVEENVAMPLILTNKSRIQCLKKARDMLGSLGLKGLEDRMSSELSGGEQQRVALARALIREPKLVLLDEPTGSLDPGTGKNVAKELWSRLRASGAAAIIATHNLELAAEADRRISLLNGELIK